MRRLQIQCGRRRLTQTNPSYTNQIIFLKLQILLFSKNYFNEKLLLLFCIPFFVTNTSFHRRKKQKALQHILVLVKFY
jgi:hypothetical protein